MIGREHYFFDNLKDMEDKEILSGFIKQYYMDNLNIPSKIMLREEIEDKESIEEWLTKMAERSFFAIPITSISLIFVFDTFCLCEMFSIACILSLSSAAISYFCDITTLFISSKIKKVLKNG